MSRVVDVAIVGQGLAGSCLAWALHFLGVDCFLIDDPASHSSSRVAAGLITPITGKRLTPSWHFAKHFAFATDFYERIAAITQATFLHHKPMIRLFQDQAELEIFQKRALAQYGDLVGKRFESYRPDCFNTPLGGFSMPRAGQLDVKQFLRLTKNYFESSYCYTEAYIDSQRVTQSSQMLKLDSLDLDARSIVFCQGYLGQQNPFFPEVKFIPAKGDILTLHIPSLGEPHIIHRGVWLVPIGADRYLCGSNAEWNFSHLEPTPIARDWIIDRFQQLCRLPTTIEEHRSGVRPVINVQKPTLGESRHQPGVWLFNGLNSKGSLLAPFFAHQLASAIVKRTPLDPEVDLATIRKSS